MNQHSLNGFSIFGLFVVLLAMIPVIYPIKITIGKFATREIKKAAVFLRLIRPMNISA